MQPIGPSPVFVQILRGLTPARSTDASPPADPSLRWDPSRLTTVPLVHAEPLAEHDDALLVAALDEIERCRRAVETLLEADLFQHCLGSE